MEPLSSADTRRTSSMPSTTYRITPDPSLALPRAASVLWAVLAAFRPPQALWRSSAQRLAASLLVPTAVLPPCWPAHLRGYGRCDRRDAFYRAFELPCGLHHALGLGALCGGLGSLRFFCGLSGPLAFFAASALRCSAPAILALRSAAHHGLDAVTQHGHFSTVAAAGSGLQITRSHGPCQAYHAAQGPGDGKRSTW